MYRKGKRMLDIKIITFLKVCEHMNYTAAAKDLNLTQPAVSKHIHFLEEYYNVKLFEYHNRKLTLTKEGIYLKNAMNAMNHDAFRIKNEIIKTSQRRKLKIGATLSIGSFYLPKTFIKYLKANADMDISLTIADTKELLRTLDGGELAFILCEGNFNKSDYSYKFLKNSQLRAFCGIDYDITGVKNIQDLFCRRILLREKGSGTREIFEHFLKEKGYGVDSFESCCEINNAEFIVKMLEENMGFSVLYSDVCNKLVKEGRLKEIPLADMNLLHEFNAVWTKGSIHGGEYEEIIGSLFKL
jgi:DNA-binding transcriptional LysR family regulator